jgi:hypothetical protein
VGFRLFTKNGGNGLDRVTTLEFLGEWMIGQCLARLLFIVSKGSLKELLKVRRYWLVTHVGSKGERNMGGERRVGLLGRNDGEWDAWKRDRRGQSCTASLIDGSVGLIW